MASLALTFSDLYNEVLKWLGTYNSGSPTANATTDAKFIVNRAYLRFLNAADWKFKEQEGTLVTDNGTWRYLLPEDFVSFVDHEFNYSSDIAYDPVTETNRDQILTARSHSTYTSYPLQFALNQLKFDKSVGGGWEVWMYPTPDSAYKLTYFYNIVPEKLVNDADIPLGGPEMSDPLLEICLAYAEAYKEDSRGVHDSIIQEILAGSMRNDKKRKSGNLGREFGGRHSPYGSVIEGQTINLFDTGETLADQT